MKFYLGEPKTKTFFISNWLNSNCGISVLEVRIIPDVENYSKYKKFIKRI